MIWRAFLAGVLAAAFLTGSASAQQASSSDVLKTLNFQHGHIELVGGIAALDLTDRYTYLDAKDSETFLTKVWSNPPGSGSDTEGMLFPANADLLSPHAWAVVLFYENDGHVSDSDASSINFDDLLGQIKKQTSVDNDDRVKKGYPAIELLGWAETPHYDAAAKTIYWAKRLRFGDSQEETLNYFIRILGRTGVLDLNVVASTSQLALVNSEAPGLMNMVSFKPGSRYSDFNAGSDHLAAYGIAGLVAGGVLLKAGFFKGLIALLAPFWKAIAVAAVGALAAVKGFFKRLRRGSRLS